MRVKVIRPHAKAVQLAVLLQFEYVEMAPVQAAALPLALAGYDLIAQTMLRSVLDKHQPDDLLAERERRARAIHAEGELQASGKLYQAARVQARCVIWKR